MPLLTAQDFIDRVNQDSLPLTDTDEIDLAKVERVLEEAEGIIKGHLPFLISDEGEDIAPPSHLASALKSIEADIAFYRLTDRVSSDEDDRNRYKEAMKLLEKFSKQEQEGLEGPGTQTASLVTTDADGEDGRFFKKGYMV